MYLSPSTVLFTRVYSLVVFDDCTHLCGALPSHHIIRTQNISANKEKSFSSPCQHCCFWTEFQSFNFTNEDSGARCWGESLLAQRGRESTQLTFLLRGCPKTKSKVLLHTLSKPSNWMSLLSTSCASFYPSSWLSIVFSLCSLPVNWLLALPLDLGLTLFNPVYNKQKALGLKVCTRAEPHFN